MHYPTILPIALLVLAAFPNLALTQPRVLSVYDITANPKRFDRVGVTLRAYGDFSEPHTATLVQDEAYDRRNHDWTLSREDSARGCLMVYNPQDFPSRNEKFDGRTLTVRGYLITGQQMKFQGCDDNPYAFWIEKVYSVHGPGRSGDHRPPRKTPD